jgi:hypothetical protein
MNLEPDLMPFLQILKRPNFEITKDFPWIKDAFEKLQKLFQENTTGPSSILQEYKKYEYILNVDKKKLINDIFKGEDGNTKMALNEIKEQIEHYERAHYEIMTLSEDEIDFRLFRVTTKKLKYELGDQAEKIKEKILKATYDYCTETVNYVFDTYN